jgi:hypothetical protein
MNDRSDSDARQEKKAKPESEQFAGVEMLQRNAEAVQHTLEYGAKLASSMTERSAAQIGRVFGFSGGGGEKAAQTASRNIEALVQSGTILTEIMPRLIEEWADIGRARIDRGFERMGALSQCRTPQDFAAFQSEVLRDNIETALSCTRKAAEAATRVAEEAKRRGLAA